MVKSPWIPGLIRRSFCVCAVFLILLLVPSLASLVLADDSPQSFPAPEGGWKVGLVLSGGGARGAAHIGVLRVLEEMRIPIHCIAGTSIGAIVGGMYAAGLSPDDIENIMTSLDWNNIFRDKPLPSDLTFRRKQDASQYLIDFDLGLKDGRLAMPKGLLQGQNLNMVLKSVLLHTENVTDFDHLRIPFRALAADIETGEAVVLDKGELVSAIRASMSIPGVFAPVERDGKMLVDGGVSNNLPVDAARRMGANVIIAVDIGTALSPRGELTSSVGITSQLITIMIQRNTAEQIRSLRENDVLIQPDLGDISTGDFTKAVQAVGIGLGAAKAARDDLARFSVDEGEYGVFLAAQRKPEDEEVSLAFVELDNKTSLPDWVINAHIDLKMNAVLRWRKLKENIDRIYGIDTFERVNFRLAEKEGKTGIVIEPVEKSWGPNYLRFGIGFEDNFRGKSSYALTGQFTKAALNRLAGEWRVEGRIGTSPRIYTELYQPLDEELKFFLAANIEYYVRNINNYSENGDILSQHRSNSARFGLDAGRQFGNWGELRAGVRRERGRVRQLIGQPYYETQMYNRASVFTSLAYSKLDNYVFPLSGTDARLKWDYNMRALGSDINVQTLSLRWMTAFTWRRFTFVPGVDFRVTLDNDDLPVQDTYPLGGFLNLSGYSSDEIYGRHTGLARLIAYRELSSRGLGGLNMPFYLGASIEAGNVWTRRSDINFDSLILAGSLFVGMKTFLGPVYLAYGQAERRHSSVYLYLGQRF